MQNQWDHSVDILVVGSGAGAMTAALRAAASGASVLIVEKSAYYGGTSATSGGGLWIPCNHLMAGVGVKDSDAAALQYLRALTKEDVPSANVEAFVASGRRMLQWITQNSRVEYVAMKEYADYYQQLPGAAPGARSVDPLPFNAAELGDELLTLQDSHRQTKVLGLMGYSNIEGAVLLSKAPGWLPLIARLTLNYFLDLPWRFRSRRSRRLTMGNALIGRLRKSLLDKQIPIWLESPARTLIREDDRVVGVTVERAGKPVSIEAKRGVILAAGGFEHSAELRTRFLPKPTATRWSAANPHNTGDMLVAATAIGADTSLLDEAWWGPTLAIDGEDRARMLFTERSMPGCIMVNRKGLRFVNESVAYTAAVQAMYRPENLPTYLIFDSRYKREYPFGPLLADGMHLNWLQPRHIKKPWLTSAGSAAELAQKLGIEPANLQATIAQFNGFAKSGVDAEFHRGENSYDLIYGDVRIGPNPCLAPLQEAPFYGVEIHPGDIGTKGGLRTDPHARVIDTTGKVIAGLYAVGNCAASVTGRHYPGAGATLGPAMTFGFLAAEHACGEAQGESA